MFYHHSQGPAIVGAVDCAARESRTLCNEQLSTARFPQIRMYPAQKEMNPYTRKWDKYGKTYEGPMHNKYIADDLKSLLVENNIMRPKSSAELTKIRTEATLPLVVLFARERKESSIVYRSLSLYFLGRLLFAEVGEKAQDLMDEFAVDAENLPTLFVLNTAGE